MKKISLKTNLKALYFMFYGGLACYFPFITVYLKNRGLSFTQIGIVFAIQSLISIIAQPVWGFVTDKYLNKKTTLLINLICCSLAIFLFIPVKSFLMIASAIFILILFQSPIMPITDTYCYELIETKPELQFGKIRLIGSVSFAIISLVLGKIIAFTNINLTFITYSLFFIAAILLLWNIEHKGNSNISRPTIKDILAVLKDYRFILFVFAVLTASISTGAHSSYVPVLIEKTGGDISNIGFVWFAQAMSELPMFFYGNRLMRRYGELNVFLFAVALYVIRFFLSSVSQDYTTAIIIQLLQGVTYPIFLVSAMQYVNKIVPNKIKASGITILSSLGFGLGGLIGNLGGGIILENHSIFFLYNIIACICLLSLLVGLMLKRITNKKYNRSPPDRRTVLFFI